MNPKGVQINKTLKPEPTDEDKMLYVRGIVSIPILLEIADNIALIRKTKKFGSVFVEVENEVIAWIGTTMKKRPPNP